MVGAFPRCRGGALSLPLGPRLHCGHVRARAQPQCGATAGKFQKGQNKIKRQYEAKPNFQAAEPGRRFPFGHCPNCRSSFGADHPVREAVEREGGRCPGGLADTSAGRAGRVRAGRLARTSAARCASRWARGPGSCADPGAAGGGVAEQWGGVGMRGRTRGGAGVVGMARAEGRARGGG